jgi:hypothetical protein
VNIHYTLAGFQGRVDSSDSNALAT